MTSLSGELAGSNGPLGQQFVFRLTSQAVAASLIGVVVVCVIIQLALGADAAVLTLSALSCLAGLVAVRIGGTRNAASWLAFFFVLGNATIALVAKSILLQPVQTRLYSPLESYAALALVCGLLITALLIARLIPVGEPVFRAVADPRFLRWLSTTTFGLGAAFWFLNRLLVGPEGSGFGGLSLFWNMLLMAVIARTALVLETTNDRRSIDPMLLLILGACVVMGLIDNQKANVALPVAAYFATCLFYRGGVTRVQTVIAVFGLVVMMTVIAPMVHVYRGLGIQDLPWRERVKLLESGIRYVSANRDMDRYRQVAAAPFVSGYYNYFGEGRGQMVLGRYASIQHIDPVIAKVNQYGAMGGTVIWPAFERLVPSVIDPHKPREIESYRILVRLGLINPLGGKASTVPLIAQSYAGYGMVGLLFIPFFAFTAILLELKKLGWQLHRNIFGIFFFSVFTMVYANQADLAQYAGAVLRGFPLLGVTLWFLTHVYRVTAFHRPATVARPVQVPG